MTVLPLSTLSASGRRCFKECQWKYLQRYVNNLQKKDRRSPALWFGTGIHEALEQWYIPGFKRGRNPAETWFEYVLRTTADTEWINASGGDSAGFVSAEELGVDMLEGYLEHYGDESHIEVLAAELPFEQPVTYESLDGTQHQRIINGFFDLIVRDHQRGGIWLWEHKTAAKLGAANTQYLPLDEQAGLYIAVATQQLRESGLIGKKEAVRGIQYNYLVKTMRDRRPRRKDGLYCNKPTKKHYVEAFETAKLDIKDPSKLSLEALRQIAEENQLEVFGDPSKDQPKPGFERTFAMRSMSEIRSQATRLKQELTLISAVEEGVLPAMKNPSRSCSFCEFADMCRLDEQRMSTDKIISDQFIPRKEH